MFDVTFQELKNLKIGNPLRFAKIIAWLAPVAGVLSAVIMYTLLNLTGYSLICILAGVIGYKLGKRKLRKMARQLYAKRTDHVYIVGTPYKVE